MTFKRIVQRSIAATFTAVAVLAMSTAGAGAQSLWDWDWGGGNVIGGSGATSVRFSPKYATGQLVASFSDRRLYYVVRPGEAISYPIAIPRQQSRWQGVMSVTDKRVNPSWTPTPTMIAENPRLPRWVPGGHPLNPLGVRALYLGSSAYRIHGTDAPWTIGQPVSKGCIRMYNKDALDVYEQTKIGAKVLVTWNSYQASPDGDADEQASAQEEAPPVHRVSTSAQTQPVPRAVSAAGNDRRVAQSRYSDVYGTPEPAAPARAAAQGSGDASAAPRAPAKAATKPAREVQPQRETRKSSGDGERAAAAAPTETASQHAKPKVSEPKAKPTSVETGALQERKPKSKAASAPAQEQMSAASAAQAEAAAKALDAAERAAAAAERAAAAAERAERALAARAAAATPAVATSPVLATQAAAPAAVAASPITTGGGD